MSASATVDKITIDDSVLQGLSPISFQINLTDLIQQEQQVLIVTEESLKSKFLLNGNSMIVDIRTLALSVKNINTIPQFVHLQNTIVQPNWNDKYKEKLYSRSIDAKVSISVGSVFLFLILLYHFINYLKRRRLPK